MKNLLIVEDEKDYLEKVFNSLTDIITDEVKIIKICSDGESALNYIINGKIDILLLDLNIPKVNGIEILETIKVNDLKIETIIMSGESSAIVEVLKRNYNINKIFVKPFKIEDLVNTLNTISIKKLDSTYREQIINMLDEFKFNKSNIGYRYVVECLIICIDNNYMNISKTQNLYKELSKKYNNISPLHIAWNVSKSIQVMNRFTEENTMNKYFPYNLSPSPKTFLNEILSIYYRKD